MGRWYCKLLNTNESIYKYFQLGLHSLKVQEKNYQPFIMGSLFQKNER